jgi:SLOG cluster3 family
MRRQTPSKIFLSASVPLPSRSAAYFATADVIAIRDAVRALVMVIIERGARLIFGGHPAITPMIRLQVLQSGRPVGDSFVMYQSRFFDRSFPDDNQFFERVVLVDTVRQDREASLEAMRKVMLDQRFQTGIFIGGMEGVEEEYAMFREMHPRTPAFPIASTGAAAGRLYAADRRLGERHPELSAEISYLTLMRNLTAPRRRRNQP